MSTTTAAPAGCPPAGTLETFARGQLPPDDEPTVRTHVEGCADCAIVVMRLKSSTDGGATAQTSAVGAPRLAHEPPVVVAEPGSRLGRYLVVSELGRGGMAVVYKAYDGELDRSVAVKVMLPHGGNPTTEPEAHARFLREAQALARVSHPNVIEVYDVGVVDNKAFIAMKLVDGVTLKEWQRARSRSWEETLAVYRAAGKGLAAAHDAGLVHRDFKATNVLVANDGSVYVTDFGLARKASSGEEERPAAAPAPPEPKGLLTADLTQAGSLSGTTGYIAPERYLGQAPDARADQFSFCVALYDALYGTLPFKSHDILKAAATLVEGTGPKLPLPSPNLLSSDPPDALSTALRPPATETGVPRWLARIVRRGLRLQPSARFPSMDALLAELGRDPKVARRRWLTAAAAVVLTGSAVAAWSVAARRQEALCAGAQAHLSGVWDPTVRAAGAQSFSGTKASFAEDSWQKTSALLDAYAANWVATRTQVCAATRIRGEQSDEVLSLRMLCLDQRLRELKSLAQLYSKADLKIVEKSTSAATGLTPLTVCDHVASLKDVMQPPADPAARKQLEAIDELLANCKAQYDSGKFNDLLPLATEVVAKADAVGYAPAQAAALLWLGRARVNTGDAVTAEAALYRAFAAADRGRDDRVRAAAGDELVYVLGVMREQHEQARAWGEITRATLTRLDGDAEIELNLLGHLGGVLFSEGKTDELLAHQLEVVKRSEKVRGVEHLKTAVAVMNLGSAYHSAGDIPQAVATYQRALALLEKTVGPKHSTVGLCLNNLAATLQGQGKSAEARPLIERGLEITRATRGPDHLVTQMSDVTLAKVMLDLDPKVGLEMLVAAHAHALKTSKPESSTVEASLTPLARAHRKLGTCAEIMGLLQEAIAIREDEKSPGYSDLPNLLTEWGSCQLQLHKPAEAVAALERALKLATKEKAPPIKLAELRLALADALWAADGDKARAVELAGAAKTAFQHAGALAEARADTWLAAHAK